MGEDRVKIYGNFNEMNKFSSCRFSLLFKLKMLNFMKRFGKTPIGISFGGFFRVKRNFPIKMLSSFYSILSALIELAKKNESTKCTSSRLLNAKRTAENLHDTSSIQPFIGNVVKWYTEMFINSDDFVAFVGIVRRMIGGKNVEIKDYPFMIALFLVVNDIDEDYFLGCYSLITTKTALGAARPIVEKEPDEIYGTIGNKDKFLGQKVNFKELIPHPYYKGTVFLYDIAVLILDNDVSLPPHVQTIALPRTNKEYYSGMATMVGWGIIGTDRKDTTRFLKATSVSIVNASDTIYKDNPLYESRSVVLTQQADVSIMPGDSGGPLVYEKDDGKRVQIGVLSAGQMIPDGLLYIHILSVYHRKEPDEIYGTIGNKDKFLGQKVNFKELIPHPYYKGTVFLYDIAVLILDNDVSLPPHVQTIALPRTNKEYYSGMATMVGWGIIGTDRKDTTRFLKATSVSIVNASDTIYKDNPLYESRSVVLTQQADVSIMPGDSGGPLVYEKDDGKRVQIGVLSAGQMIPDGMLNFMKRFGKTPIGISVGGFFRVKRNFPIKMLSSLYSILSALIELGKKNKSTKCTSLRSLNASNIQNTSLY
ncbi:uncharacterized protein LOC111624597 [Centruroides sculpturatus]|uniref:uncharacterized protein LOC111624597 n=1 Tax=Centruroides sculpturatus TaxID=218467 RepID=UPI000C6D4C5B|nr:uncharacterized protein LOC111624597 [Centruroides sculpturatus]